MSDDDWDVDLDAVNELTTEQSRWGSGAAAVDESPHSMLQLREKVLSSDQDARSAKGYESSYGYGGKFGVQKDRMDKVAVDASYKAEISKHSSVLDNKVGFGGKYGVQTDRQDKSAADWSYKEEAQKHQSQKDYKTGFGGKFGVQTDRKDKSAADWSYKEEAQKHQSQKDYKSGFGGKFGVQTDRKDASAETWSYKSDSSKHASQTDGSKGFGGKYGVETEKKDVSAHGWEGGDRKPTVPSKPRVESGVSVGSVKSMFEKPKGDQATDSVAKYRAARAEQERKEREAQLARHNQTNEHNSSALVTGSKVPNRAEEARQLVAQSKVSATASQFNQQPMMSSAPAPRPVPARPKAAAPLTPQTVQTPSPVVSATSVADEKAAAREKIAQIEAEKARQEAEEERRQNALLAEQQERVAIEMEQMRVEREKEREEEQANVISYEAAQPEPAVSAEFTPTITEGLCAVAQYDYSAAGDDELSFWANDIVTNIDTSVDAGWWMGSCNGTTGLFPSNFVEVIQSTRWAQGAGVNEGAVSSTIVGPEAEIGKSDGVYFDPSANGADENAQLDLSKLPQALALYQFASDDPQDLAFEPDETVAVQNLDNEDWWFGYIGERQGYFPANHVQLLG